MTDLDLSSAHARLRASNPLIQCITNTVVQQFSANVLLAVGASPAMLDHEADADAETMEDAERSILAGLGIPDPYADSLAASAGGADDRRPATHEASHQDTEQGA